MTYKRAVEILKRKGPLTAMEFARIAWPNSPGWDADKKIGNRNVSVRGAGMSRAALGLLGRLKKGGLVEALYGDGPTYWRVR